MRTIKPNTHALLSSVTATVMVLAAGFCSPALSASLSLSDAPLYLTIATQPNLIMAIDDSGSMDFEMLLPTNDGAAWWHKSTSSSCPTQTFVGCGSDGTNDLPTTNVLNVNRNGSMVPSDNNWEKFVMLFPNGCSQTNTSFQDRNCGRHWALPPLPALAWAHSPDFNTAYFDPSATYAPWTSGGSDTFANSSPTAARFDPVFGANSDAVDLTQDSAAGVAVSTGSGCSGNSPSYSADAAFHIFTGMVLPSGTCIRTAFTNWKQLSSSVTVPTVAYPDDTEVNIRYYPATFYLKSTESPPTGYGYTATALTGSAPDGSTLNGYEIKSANFSTTPQYTAAMQNFANWFTYYRKRHQALRGGLGAAFKDTRGINVDGFTINNVSGSPPSAPNVVMKDFNSAADRTTWYDLVYRSWTGRGGTPNRKGVYNIVRNLKRTGAGAPITRACQTNYGMLFTDGYSNQPASGDGFSGIGNKDGGAGAPYQDSSSDTMADGIFDAYSSPLVPSPTFALGQVPIPEACSDPAHVKSLDCNKNLHMDFYAITLGTRGILYNPDASPAQDPYASPPTWPTSLAVDRNPVAVDDLWHATINGRGALLNANSPVQIASKLGSVLQAIFDHEEGSASSAAVNSGSLNTDTRVYQAKFDPDSWTGRLLAYDIDDTTGAVAGTATWEASANLPAFGSRKIITQNSTGAAVAFTSTDLDLARTRQLDPSATAVNTTLAQSMVNYLRGDTSNEGTGTGQFRVRKRKSINGTTKALEISTDVLGDIIDSSPVFVGAPRFAYPDSLQSPTYSAFVTAKKTRTPMIYVGANDGMLHAFQSTDGVEAFAFIPGSVFPNLKALTSPTYAHQYYVDGSPQEGDVFFSGAWHTMLVGGLNKGGQGIYALDVTDPSTFASAQSSPGSIFKWQFTDANDADLGFTFSQPQIVRLHNGKWAAVFGNGYNSTDADGHAGTGNAALFIVDIETGALIRKISVGAGPTGTPTPNGLATPALVDLDGDRIVDYAYAGDLGGNLWKFDLTSTTAASWDVAYKPGGTPTPLYTAKDTASPANLQPITERPVVVRGLSGVGMMILFGTGKFLEGSDNLLSPQRTQTFYGIQDKNTGVTLTDTFTGRTSLLQQTITNELLNQTFGTQTVDIRVTSNNSMGGTQRGWYLDLLSPSGYQNEKSVTNPIVRDGHLIFTTTIPSDDPCVGGGSSWLMELDALSGSRLGQSPFDLNNDGQFTVADWANLSPKVPPSGLSSSNGILTSPVVVADPVHETEYKYMPGTKGNIATVTENPGKGRTGRQAWRQIR